MKTIVQSFVKYTVYFRGIENEGMCSRGSLHNITESTIYNNLSVCPNEKYRIRRILRSQISWKPVDNQGKRGNSSHVDAKNQGTNQTNNKDKVHNFLAFALLLPEHPFSKDMEIAMRQVAPMFPQISMIVGDAHEFADLSSKYLIHAYPALLFFKGGIYVGDFHEDKVNVADLAAYLSWWTRSFPRSIPNTITVKTVIRSPRSFMPAANMEPFLGSISFYNELDRICYLAAAFYCCVRALQIFFSKL